MNNLSECHRRLCPRKEIGLLSKMRVLFGRWIKYLHDAANHADAKRGLKHIFLQKLVCLLNYYQIVNLRTNVYCLLPLVYLLYCVCIAVLHTLAAGLLARSQYPEGPGTGHLDTGFSRFPCVYKQTLRRFPTFQVVTTCFSCSPPDLNLVVTNFIFCIHVK